MRPEAPAPLRRTFTETERQAAVDLMARRGRVTSKTVADALGLTVTEAQHLLDGLRRSGRARRLYTWTLRGG